MNTSCNIDWSEAADTYFLQFFTKQQNIFGESNSTVIEIYPFKIILCIYFSIWLRENQIQSKHTERNMGRENQTQNIHHFISLFEQLSKLRLLLELSSRWLVARDNPFMNSYPRKQCDQKNNYENNQGSFFQDRNEV